jgi:predicted methyltransferase
MPVTVTKPLQPLRTQARTLPPASPASFWPCHAPSSRRTARSTPPFTIRAWSAKFVARDPARHPLEELGFFGVATDSTIVEIWPGGYWTEILAPFLRDHGT